jgi:hypothetical protein
VQTSKEAGKLVEPAAGRRVLEHHRGDAPLLQQPRRAAQHGRFVPLRVDL